MKNIFGNDFKIIIIGTSATGKTNFVNKYTQNILMIFIKKQLYLNLDLKYLKKMVNYIDFNFGI